LRARPGLDAEASTCRLDEVPAIGDQAEGPIIARVELEISPARTSGYHTSFH
jgi:hypothetical protein